MRHGSVRGDLHDLNMRIKDVDKPIGLELMDNSCDMYTLAAFLRELS